MCWGGKALTEGGATLQQNVMKEKQHKSQSQGVDSSSSSSTAFSPHHGSQRTKLRIRYLQMYL